MAGEVKMPHKCPVCNLDVGKPIYSIDNRKTSWHHYSCQRCGDYSVEYSFSSVLPQLLNNDIKKIAVLSHWIRIQHEAIAKEPSDEHCFRKTITLNEESVVNIIKNPPPNPAEQADNIIRWLGANIKAFGENINLKPNTHLSIMGAITPNGFHWVLDHLIESDLLQKISSTTAGEEVTLSFKGWQHYEKLKRGATDSRKAFMAMKYGDKQLDKIVEEVFKPAVKQTGFDLFKLPDRPKAGLIDDQLRIEIQTSRFLVADLTHDNLGAYWEAGYAEGLGKPVIYTCEKKIFDDPKTKPHFDTNHHLTIPWDAENPKEAAEKLKVTIRATLPGEAKSTDD
jgi:hypothetical protein